VASLPTPAQEDSVWLTLVRKSFLSVEPVRQPSVQPDLESGTVSQLTSRSRNCHTAVSGSRWETYLFRRWDQTAECMHNKRIQVRYKSQYSNKTTLISIVEQHACYKVALVRQSEVDILAFNTKLCERGRRLYGWDDFAGSRCKMLHWTEEKKYFLVSQFSLL